MISWRWTGLPAWVLGGALCSVAGLSAAQSIYTCVDSRGRRLTHDRPIPECTDREQRELNPSGTVKRSIGPTLTDREAELEEQRRRKDMDERSRTTEARRQDRALITRYQNPAAHNAARADALLQVDEVMAFAVKRMAELDQQRQRLNTELEFYKDPATIPVSLRQKMAEHAADVAVQRRFIADQELEKKRINARFDAEAARLRQLWVHSQNNADSR